jgi:hypothetical protein
LSENNQFLFALCEKDILETLLFLAFQSQNETDVLVRYANSLFAACFSLHRWLLRQSYVVLALANVSSTSKSHKW